MSGVLLTVLIFDVCIYVSVHILLDTHDYLMVIILIVVLPECRYR